MKKTFLFVFFFVILSSTGCSKRNLFVDVYNPGNCIEAKSQCNTCNRDNLDETFICTEDVCQPEKFSCVKYYDKNEKKDNNLGEACQSDSDCFCEENPEQADICSDPGFILKCSNLSCSLVSS